MIAASNAMTVARRGWLAAAFALLDHTRGCIPCIGRSDCAEHAALGFAPCCQPSGHERTGGVHVFMVDGPEREANDGR